jgi:16S rRNA (cytosine967-C5)-methyltransferase
MPPWLIDTISADWPAQADNLFADTNREPPLMLRANRRRIARDALIEQLRTDGYTIEAHPWLVDGMVLPHSTDVTRMPGFAQGFFAVQDGAAQVAADLADIHNGQRVLDACAAPGGKACHLLERADIALTALEFDTGRAKRIHQNLDRLGLKANVQAGDAGDPSGWWDGKPYDRILIDAPCSATGVIRRRPDIRLHRRASDISALVAQQQRILAALWPLLAPGGRLVYITCSLLRAENEAVIGNFLASRNDVDLLPLTLPAGQAAATGWQILPGDGDLDGMYYAVLGRR